MIQGNVVKDHKIKASALQALVGAVYHEQVMTDRLRMEQKEQDIDIFGL